MSRSRVLELVSKVGVESAEADDATAEAEEALVDVAAAFVAGRESSEGVQPGEGAFHDPAPATESGAMLGLAAGDAVADPARSQQAAVLVVVIATVGDDHQGPLTGTPGAAADGWDAVKQWHQLGHVVTVASARAPRQREPARVDDQVVFCAQPPAIDRARARLRAPFLACTWLPSTHARDQSMRSTLRNFASSTACNCSHTAASVQASKRRQQVTPEPYPSCCGSARQGIPVTSTNKIPSSAARSDKRGLPNTRTGTGSNGSTTAQSSSETSHDDPLIPTPIVETTTGTPLQHTLTRPFHDF